MRLVKVMVLRLGHRPRDFRVTSHVALTARALGASGLVLADRVDEKIEATVRKVVANWGGPFHFEAGAPAQQFIKKWKADGGQVIHLTMYGLHIDDVIDTVRKSDEDKLVVVGAEKVPSEIFRLADYNVAVGHQPHSEVASLAVFLDRLFEGRELHKQFENARLRIAPSPRGKRVIKLGQEATG